MESGFKRGFILLLISATLLLLLPGKVSTSKSENGEFVAGSFILTQKSLNEAPYRYAGILRKALDKVETRSPPSQSDEQNCDVKYRIRPSGRRSKLRIKEDTLAIQLKEDNTVVLQARVAVQVAARTWIWKGINFGLLGCLKMNSCNGQIVTYSADVDFQIAFQASWDAAEKRLSIQIKPVNTILHDVFVEGCKPPWYLAWFKKWQDLLNKGVREAFQEFADTYQHQAEVPDEFSPLKGVYIKHKITNLIWNKDYIIFQSNATFSAEVDGRNETFQPSPASQSQRVTTIPVDNWNLASPTDGQAHMLQVIN